MRKLWNLLISLEIGLVLLALVCCAMAAGSFTLSGEIAAALNGMPLFAWLREFPFLQTWWLWLTIIVLALLVLNTLCCSTDSIFQRFRRNAIRAWLPPQLIHAGFLLIVAAHLQSSVMGMKGSIEIREGDRFQMPDGTAVHVARIGALFSPGGGQMPLGYKALLVSQQTGPDGVTITPNHPLFINGYGVYIKHAEPGEPPVAFLEVHREPGAGLALAGALLFTIGNVVLLYTRSKSRELSGLDS
ncbi:cytochrome c biogenesis protein ResB [Pelotalea chapellei]|uniref:Cytochrome C biogenesis protein ResB n=1 Tax=Pelotalea chapellei TaxID=44671 RepID=A0ABS5U3G2_9BACT|nr:cytochrome c biogenesis protein ResB [Pelotalea chapellei]MBT1070208.1 cytochrome C biogenesis protein ResB [Pelotalea chapellei]